MRKTGFLKRMISMICIISIMTISFVQPSFAANTAPTITSNDGYTYEIEWQNDTDFILTGFINGTAIDRVTGSIGGEYLTLETFEQGNMVQDRSNNTVSRIKVSDIIIPAEDEQAPEVTPVPVTYASSAGSIQYRVLADKYYYYTINVDYEIINTSKVSEYEINADANTNLSLFIGAVLNVTGIALGTGIAAGIIRLVGGIVSGGKITKGAHGYFSGTQYDYNIGAENRAVSPIVRRTHSGKAFNGNTRIADQAWKTDQKVYEGYYPQFIREKDTTVAGWIFNDFFSGTYDVYKWSSLI